MTILLEDFADVEAAGVATQPVADRYDEGFADGVAQAKAEQASTDAACLLDLVQTLSDLDIGYREAQQAVLTSLEPLLVAVAETLVPSLLDASVADHLRRMILAAAEQDSSRAITLWLSPECIDPLEASLPDIATPLLVKADDALQRGQAILSAGDGETLLDVAQACETISNLVQAIGSPSEQDIAHG